MTYNDKSLMCQEAEANKFASFLLMPIDDFRNQIGRDSASLDLLGHCANRYNVSLTAATIKWLEFTAEAAMVVVARDGFVCWSYTSQSARRLKVYLASGTSLPENDRDHLLISNNRNKMQVVSPGVWHPRLEAVESFILSDKFDLAIYLIQFTDANHISHEEDDEIDTFDFLSARTEGMLWKK